MIAPTSSQLAEIDAITGAFFEGKVDQLKHRYCPICNGGKLLFKVSKHVSDLEATPGRRYKANVYIYCDGVCDAMISYTNGYCPGWAEEIDDWERFSAELYE